MYAKIKDNVVIQFPYGFDELQSEFDKVLTGNIDILNTFKLSNAYLDGFTIHTVTQQQKPLMHSAGEKHILAELPVLVNDQWTLVWQVEAVQYPTDGKTYKWNPTSRAWDEE
jgi:hypothetical protein